MFRFQKVLVIGVVASLGWTFLASVSKASAIVDFPDVVTFSDANLEDVVRSTLGISPPASITDADMLTMTALDAGSCDVTQLQGMEYATNLYSLYLADNQISDVSALAGLTNLHFLGLENNQISDISTLAGMTGMMDLSLSYNQVGDISALAGMTNLQMICMWNNEISDISALAGLTNMERLYLSDNQINDISALAGMTKLYSLDLNDNQGISNISAVAGLTNLTNLYLSGNQIGDISAVAGLTELDLLSFGRNQISDISAVAGLTNLTELYLDSNTIEDISAVVGLSSMNHLVLRDNQISDISAVAGLTNLDFLSLGSNQISDVSALSGLNNLNVLDLGDNQLSNVSTLTGLTSLVAVAVNDNQIEVLNLHGASLSGLQYFDVKNNPLAKVVLANAALSQTSFDTLMTGGVFSTEDIPTMYGTGIAEMDDILSLDLSGVDFASVSDLASMYGLYNLKELLLTDATNLSGSQIVTLTNELESLDWLDVTGLWDDLDSTSQDSLTAWDALDGNILITQSLPGDVDGDGVVGTSDAAALEAHWQAGVNDGQLALRAMGDFNGDGCVDGSDATILAGYWQSTTSTDPPLEGVIITVPEPSTFVMLLVMAMSVVLWRKRLV